MGRSNLNCLLFCNPEVDSSGTSDGDPIRSVLCLLRDLATSPVLRRSNADLLRHANVRKPGLRVFHKVNASLNLGQRSCGNPSCGNSCFGGPGSHPGSRQGDSGSGADRGERDAGGGQGAACFLSPGDNVGND